MPSLQTENTLPDNQDTHLLPVHIWYRCLDDWNEGCKDKWLMLKSKRQVLLVHGWGERALPLYGSDHKAFWTRQDLAKCKPGAYSRGASHSELYGKDEQEKEGG